MRNRKQLSDDERFAIELERQHEALIEYPQCISARSDPSGFESVDDSQILADRIAAAKPVLDLLHKFRDKRDELQHAEVERDAAASNRLHDRAATIGLFSTFDDQAGVANSSIKIVPNIEQIGRFEIQREIGRGGYGIVVLARDPQLDRQVAIKIPRIEAALSRESRNRFTREARAAAVLSHPNIVAVYEAGHDQGIDFIVSQFVDGDNLANWLSLGNSVDPTESAVVVSVLAEAIEHAHQRGVLHRDLKPSNILIEHFDADEGQAALSKRCRIADFGLATILDQQSEQPTQTGVAIGTPAYMSPEQAIGEINSIGPATDVYGLGVILYQLLTDTAPFSGNSLFSIIASVRETDPVSTRRANPRIPVDLDAICLKCLEKKPENRYPSAFELQNDLERFLSGRPVQARPVSTWTRLLRTIRRHPQTSALLGSILFLLALLAAGASAAAWTIADSRQDVITHLEKEILAKDAATHSEELAIRAVYEARLSEARALINSGAQGQRQAALNAIKAAAQHIDRLDLDADQLFRLRSAVVASASLIDVEAVRQLELADNYLAIEHDSQLHRYALAAKNRKTVEIRNAADDQLVATLKFDMNYFLTPRLFFSPDNQHLAAIVKSHSSNGFDRKSAIVVWNLNDKEGKPRSIFDAYWSECQSADFSFDGKRLAFIQPDSDIAVVDLATMQVESRFKPATTPSIVRFSRTSDRLALYRRFAIDLLKLVPNPELVMTMGCPSRASVLDWSYDDQLIAAGCHNARCMIWETENGDLTTILNGHAGAIKRIGFHPSGELIATSGHDGSSRIWSTLSGVQLLTSDESNFQKFAGDGIQICAGFNILRLVHDAEHRILNLNFENAEKIDIHSSGLLIANNSTRFEMFDLSNSQRVASRTIHGGYYSFSPNGLWLLIASKYGLYRLPIRQEFEKDAARIEFGQPELLADTDLSGHVATSHDASAIGVAVRYPTRNETVKAVIYRENDKSLKPLEPYPRMARWVSMTSDGKWLATGTWHGSNVEIWDTETGSPIKTIKTRNAQVAFSADAKMLAIDTGAKTTLWETQNWTELFTPLEKASNSAPMPIAFSPNNEILAVLKSLQKIEFVNTESCEPIVEFTVPESQSIQSLRFSPDGKTFVAGTNRGKIHVWNLARIQESFSDVGLSWDYSLAAKSVGRRTNLEVHLNLQEIVAKSNSVIVQSILATDNEFGEIRNESSKRVPLAQSIEGYVYAMEKLPALKYAPADFATAFVNHKNAWNESVRFFNGYQELRGEMHELFEQIRSSSPEASVELTSCEEKIWGSWEKVEAIAAKYSAAVPDNRPTK